MPLMEAGLTANAAPSGTSAAATPLLDLGAVTLPACSFVWNCVIHVRAIRLIRLPWWVSSLGALGALGGVSERWRAWWTNHQIRTRHVDDNDNADISTGGLNRVLMNLLSKHCRR